MNVIGLAVGFYELGILKMCNGAQVGLETASPFRFNEGSAAFGTPDEMDVYTKKFPCHTLYNWIVGMPVEKISTRSTAPSALGSQSVRIPALRPGLLTLASSRLARAPLRSGATHRASRAVSCLLPLRGSLVLRCAVVRFIGHRVLPPASSRLARAPLRSGAIHRSSRAASCLFEARSCSAAQWCDSSVIACRLLPPASSRLARAPLRSGAIHRSSRAASCLPPLRGSLVLCCAVVRFIGHRVLPPASSRLARAPLRSGAIIGHRVLLLPLRGSLVLPPRMVRSIGHLCALFEARLCSAAQWCDSSVIVCCLLPLRGSLVLRCAVVRFIGHRHSAATYSVPFIADPIKGHLPECRLRLHLLCRAMPIGWCRGNRAAVPGGPAEVTGGR